MGASRDYRRTAAPLAAALDRPSLAIHETRSQFAATYRVLLVCTPICVFSSFMAAQANTAQPELVSDACLWH